MGIERQPGDKIMAWLRVGSIVRQVAEREAKEVTENVTGYGIGNLGECKRTEFVIACCMEEFERWLREHGCNKSRYKYVANVDDIRGRSDTVLHLVGRYWLRKDLDLWQIEQYCSAVGIKIVREGA